MSSKMGFDNFSSFSAMSFVVAAMEEAESLVLFFVASFLAVSEVMVGASYSVETKEKDFQQKIILIVQ